MVPGLIGQIQALEIVKIILGMDKTQILTQRMVIFDALSMTFRNVKIRGKMKDCVACGENATITDVSKIDYAEFCQTNCNLASMIKLPAENSIPMAKFGEFVKDTESIKNNVIIDVRPVVHFGIVNLPGSVNVPWKAMERDPN